VSGPDVVPNVKYDRVSMRFRVTAKPSRDIQHALMMLTDDVVELGLLSLYDDECKTSRFMSTTFVSSRRKIPTWFMKPLTNVTKFLTRDGIMLTVNSDRTALISCDRRNICHTRSWASVMDIAVHRFTLRDVMCKLVYSLPSGVAWDRDIAAHTIESDAILSSVLAELDETTDVNIAEHDVDANAVMIGDMGAGDNITRVNHGAKHPVVRARSSHKLLFNLHLWVHDRSCRVLFTAIEDAIKSPKAYVTMSNIATDDDVELVSIVISRFYMLYVQALLSRIREQPIGRLRCLRDMFPHLITSGYSRESAAIPIIADEQDLMTAAPNEVIWFPRNDPNGVYLIAPRGYYIGIKWSINANECVPVCYKTNHLLNPKSTTWRYCNTSDDISPTSSGTAIFATLRRLPMHRIGRLPVEFVSTYGLPRGYHRVGLGDRLLSSLCDLFKTHVTHCHIHDNTVVVNNVVIHPTICAQEYWSRRVDSLTSHIYDVISRDMISPDDYRVLEEIFDVNVIFHVIVDCNYRGVYMPHHNDVYLWSQRQSKRFIVIFVNKFHTITTYEILTLYEHGTHEWLWSCDDNTHNVDVYDVLLGFRSLTYTGLSSQHVDNVVSQSIDTSGKCYRLVLRNGDNMYHVPCYTAPMNIPITDNTPIHDDTAHYSFFEQYRHIIAKDDINRGCIYFDTQQAFEQWLRQQHAMTS
jgi:hypothetical protein